MRKYLKIGIISLICIIFFSSTAATGQVKPAEATQSLGNVLTTLAAKYKVNFLYEEANVTHQKVKYEASLYKGKSISEILNSLLVPINLSWYKVDALNYSIFPKPVTDTRKVTQLKLPRQDSLAQDQVGGRVVDEHQIPLVYTPVTLLTAIDSALVQHALTDPDGDFKFMDIKAGTYKIRISAMGKMPYTTKQFAVGGVVHTGSEPISLIVLEPQAVKLKEVTITRKQPLVEQKVDRYIFNVGKSATAMGNDGVQLLRKIPGIQISASAISLAGKGKVKVMINDRLLTLSDEDLLNYLQTLRSDDISTVEVITNPSAKYDAQGNSGLINIKLRKSTEENFSGNVSVTYSQASYASANVGTGLNYKKNKLSLSANLSTGDGSVNETADEKIYYTGNPRFSNETVRAYNRYISGRISADYEPRGNATIGIHYSGNKSSPDSKDRITVNYLQAKTGPSNGSLTTGNTESNLNYSNSGIYYMLRLDTLGKKVNVAADYFLYKTLRDRQFTSNSINENEAFGTNQLSAANWGKQDMKIYTSNIDAELPYRWAKMELGGKLSLINNQNNIGFQNLTADTMQSDRFKYKEHIYAIYATAYKKLGKWEAKAGLRFESTITEGISVSLNQNNKRNYHSLFPSAYLSYSPDQSHKFSLNYGKRINRPSYEALNPFRWYLNMSSYRAGNPFLKPESIDNIEFSHSYKNTWVSKIYASKTANWYERVTYVSAQSPIQAYIYENYATFYTVGVSQAYSFEIPDIWESSNQVMAYYNYSDMALDVLRSKTKGLSGFLSTTNSFVINSAKTVFAELNYSYQLPAAITQYELGHFQDLTIGLKVLLFDKRLQLGLNGSDLFRTNAPKIIGYTNDIRQEYKNYGDLRRVGFSVSYKFGSDKLKANQRSTSNEAETVRAR